VQKIKIMEIEEMIKDKKGTVVDVRTPAEFNGGSVAGALNFPLHEIPNRVEEIKELKKPLILCCRSGNRSGQAQQFLTEKGIECYNGGSWLDVNFYLSQND